MQITTAIPVAGVDTGATVEVEDGYGAWLVANGYATKGKAQRTGAGQDQAGATPTLTPTPSSEGGTPSSSPTSGQGKSKATKKSSTKTASS